MTSSATRGAPALAIARTLRPLAPALALLACAPAVLPRDAGPSVPIASTASTASAPVASAPPPSPLDRAVAQELARARADGLALRSRADLAPMEVSVLELGRGEPQPARVSLVGVAQPSAIVIDGTPARAVAPILGAAFPDLRGDGARFAVVEAQRCGAGFCAWPRARVFEARPGVFVEAQGPSHPASLADVDGDRLPDFAVELVQVPLCEGCDPARVPDGEDGEALIVVGLESWEAGAWARDLASFERWYRDGLAEARADAKALAAIKPKERQKRCPRDVIQDAAIVLVFARVLGAPAAKASAEADAIVAGWDAKACPAMRGARRPWGELKKELASAPLPTLTRKRAAAP